MKVNMSPAAVTQRLRTMDDLWRLSVKLMGSRKIAGDESSASSRKKDSQMKGNSVDEQFGLSDDEPSLSGCNTERND